MPPTPAAVGAHVYLALASTALAYVLWFRGIRLLPARIPAFLVLLSPVVALLIGLTVAGETLAIVQVAGLILVLGSVVVVVATSGRRSAVVPREPAGAGTLAWRA